MNNKQYIFLPVYINNNALLEIYSLIKYDNDYDQIIKNKDNQLFTVIGNIRYILLKKTDASDSISNNIIRNSKKYVLHNQNYYIDKSNWSYLWSKKIDYIEYQIMHFQNKYPIINKSVWYYIGMAENAIQYINYTLQTHHDIDHRLVISHRRINNDDFYFPLNLVVDYSSRDISEYLKYLFLENQYNYNSIKDFLFSFDLNEFDLKLLYGRLFFVTFYFDLYDLIITGKKDEHQLVHIINRCSEYEDYINRIYSIICNIKKIPKIDWI